MKAAILEKIGVPLTVTDHLDLPRAKLERGQVLIRVLCAGICGSQIHEIDGTKGNLSHLPHLLGHEGCGMVEKIGSDVMYVKPGDKVVMHWRKGRGIEAVPAIYMWGDRSTVKAGAITTFSEFAVVSENRVTPAPEDMPNDLVALLGCALSTALATVENVARIRFGESALIIGCGGVGLSMILAARLAQAHPIVGCDKVESKWQLVTDLRADFRAIQPYARDRFDVIIDTVGNCFFPEFLQRAGRHVAVGYSPGGSRNVMEGGEFNPSDDIPRYVNLWRSGALNDYNKIITHRLLVRDINEGIKLMREGQAGRVMIEFHK